MLIHYIIHYIKGPSQKLAHYVSGLQCMRIRRALKKKKRQYKFMVGALIAQSVSAGLRAGRSWFYGSIPGGS
jgi:uncharacterized membrane protein YjdF